MHTRRSFLRTSLAVTTAVLADVSSIVAKERPTPSISKLPSDAYVNGVKFVTPDAPDYASAREVYNAGILTQPKIIASCISETGVQHAIERAKTENWPVAVKAGGHSFEGFCLNDDGLVVTVSPMREMQLDPKTGILTAGAGCRLEEVNQFLLTKGRFLPAGSCRTVGLAGLTLGGGYGCSPENGVWPAIICAESKWWMAPGRFTTQTRNRICSGAHAAVAMAISG